MNPDLEKLVQLQRAESELHRVESDLAEVPKARTVLDDRLAEERERLDTTRNALDECQKNRPRHEGELQDLEAKRSKYKSQLMEVKTNKEYTALLHEIEAVERQIGSREDQILEEMERTESLTAEVKKEEGVFTEAEGRHGTEQADLEKRSRELEQDAQRHKAERDAIAGELPEDALELFQRVARLRGVAVTMAHDGMCHSCHVVLRPQTDRTFDPRGEEECAPCAWHAGRNVATWGCGMASGGAVSSRQRVVSNPLRFRARNAAEPSSHEPCQKP